MLFHDRHHARIREIDGGVCFHPCFMGYGVR